MNLDMYLLPVIMFSCLLISIVINVPVAFGAGIVGLISGYLLWGDKSLFIILTSTSNIMNSWVLVAVPLFVFMANMLDKLGIIEGVYDAFYKVAGGLKGGLAAATIIVGTIMGAMTGIAAGTTVALGLIAVPQMLKRGYEKSLALGPVMVAGMLCQVIPPSVSMIIYGALTQTSVGGLFASGVTVGLMLSGLYVAYVLIKPLFFKLAAPALPKEQRATWKEKVASVRFITFPALLILGVLGSIFSGAATPTEGASVGCMGAVLAGALNRRLKWSIVMDAARETIKTTAMCGWILIGASVFGSVFTGVGGGKLVLAIAQVIPGGTFGVLTGIIVILFILGCFMDSTAIMVITAPIFVPVAKTLGLDLIWFGMIFLIVLILGFITPPFGYSLFYMKGVVPPDINLGDIYKATIPFIFLTLLGVVIMIIFPPVVTWLPRFMLK